MNNIFKQLGHWKSILAIVGGSVLLMLLEILEDPDLGFWDIVLEMIQPTLIVIVAVGMVRLIEQINIQHETQMLLIKDLETARVEGMQWRGKMSDLIKGLSEGIATQFTEWGLTPAEREVGLLILKGLSYKEIAIIRNVSEKTVRLQAHTIYRKAKLSGRAALSAYFLEDLLLPSEPTNKTLG
ncbi:MAG: helix-turn-helix transcriptional regulator [Candidatus Thiodiazotropha sp. 6PLUC2]